MHTLYRESDHSTIANLRRALARVFPSVVEFLKGLIEHIRASSKPLRANSNKRFRLEPQLSFLITDGFDKK